MSVLSKTHILEALEKKHISFSPPIDAFQLQPHAIDLRLGYTFRIPRSWTIDDKGRRALKISIEDSTDAEQSFEEITLKPGQYFDLLPNEFVIATSLETIQLASPHLMAVLFPRTSTNRRGIDLSLSGIIDTGYNGTLIFPMKNETGDQVLRLYPGERICQIIFHELSAPLSLEEANQHGLSEAKYHATGDASYKLDKKEERVFLTGGNVDLLKQKYPLKS